MPDDCRPTPTQLIERWQAGDDAARAGLMEALHGEMRGIARRLMKAERGGHTLQPTAVVHEACLRLLGGDAEARSRGEFLGLATHVMRRVLVDHARRRDTEKRGVGWERVTLNCVQLGHERTAGLVDALDLDAALERLARVSPRQAQVAELRYFGGLSIAETAEVLGVGVSTVKDEWTVARLWLGRELEGHGSGPGP